MAKKPDQQLPEMKEKPGQQLPDMTDKPGQQLSDRHAEGSGPALPPEREEMMGSLTNNFLIAMPELKDPHFFQTVTLICEHNHKGALGVVVNRSTDLKLGELLNELALADIGEEARQRTVNYGGPVQMDRGFILHEPIGKWESTLAVGPTLGLTASLDILRAIACGNGPARNLIALGYAGWGPGQLEQEIADNAWLVAAGDPGIVFDTPETQRWRIAAESLGVDLNLISSGAGHA